MRDALTVTPAESCKLPCIFLIAIDVSKESRSIMSPIMFLDCSMICIITSQTPASTHLPLHTLPASAPATQIHTLGTNPSFEQ